ncbi:hypothetical protein MLD59_12455 [Verrucomicrobiaceae bacterium E54]|nr:hypothetical protein [Verrucomicrobiaceae bacterium E54]
MEAEAAGDGQVVEGVGGDAGLLKQRRDAAGNGGLGLQQFGDVTFGDEGIPPDLDDPLRGVVDDPRLQNAWHLDWGPEGLRFYWNCSSQRRISRTDPIHIQEAEGKKRAVPP